MTASVPWWPPLKATKFGSAGLDERLAALILAGRKRATVWDGREPNEMQPGMQRVVIFAERPVAVIETTSVELSRFDQIDSAFAQEEGRGKVTAASTSGVSSTRPSFATRGTVRLTCSSGANSFG